MELPASEQIEKIPDWIRAIGMILLVAGGLWLLVLFVFLIIFNSWEDFPPPELLPF